MWWDLNLRVNVCLIPRSPPYPLRYREEARTVPPDRGVRKTLVLAFGNRYPEWMPFLTSDRGRDSNPSA
ncbi:hypothetical protein E2C01_060531 [Portunus trituberculatus]|uniref:Uncharacterized protein n=1 Tax=Portunus trituberculatus TaxID=210409 RepID=A0A5B7HCC7_PORTR|nr:hypothetical protein [Portunus trituberculatus]